MVHTGLSSRVLRITALALIIMLTGVALVGAAGSSEPEEPVIRLAQVLAEDNPQSGAMNEQFAADLEAALGIRVDARVIMEYGVGIEAMRGGQLDLMLVSPMSYYQAQQRTGIVPIATTGGFGGVPYKSVFVTRADRDDIQTLEDLRGRTFAFVDPGSSSGYIYPKVSLVQQLDLDPDRVEDPGYFFETATYSGRHDASVMGVLMGDYDAAVVAYALLPIMSEAGAIDANDLRIIAETPDIPNPLYIASDSLDSGLIEQIREFYLGYDNADYFDAVYGDGDTRYVPVNVDDYQIIYDLVDLLGITEEL